jgi:Cu(I)/Ag(I) efflux system membrane protein CusA/SilA
MVEKIIELSVRHKWVVFGVVLMLALFAANSARTTPLDALPDISDPQVIIFTEWMGRSPDLVEDQITYPLVRALQSTPGVRTVRGYSMFGMSFTYALFDEGTDIYWARTRVLEQLGRVQQQLPQGVSPTLGPDASGVGWVYQYVLRTRRGGWIWRSSARCRTSPSAPRFRPSSGSPKSRRSAGSSGSTRSWWTRTGWSVSV